MIKSKIEHFWKIVIHGNELLFPVLLLSALIFVLLGGVATTNIDDYLIFIALIISALLRFIFVPEKHSAELLLAPFSLAFILFFVILLLQTKDSNLVVRLITIFFSSLAFGILEFILFFPSEKARSELLEPFQGLHLRRFCMRGVYLFLFTTTVMTILFILVY